MQKHGYVYILSNPGRTVLYTGVTSNLIRRIHQHKTKSAPGFTKRYNCTDLLWWQQSDSIDSAITREKQIKAGSRKKKVALIEEMNPEWRDLSETL
ncbi:MAG: GIY-YIG nuclease family protein [Gammaproteobacteria bacterium]|nr:GIY-YIG nuclease family protein [Gammaproteobacteria bacterium]